MSDRSTSGEVCREGDPSKETLNPLKFSDILPILCKEGWIQGAAAAVSSKTLNTELDSDARKAIEWMKRNESHPATMDFDKLRAECDDMYKTTTKMNRMKIRQIMSRFNFFPSEISNPEMGTDENPWLGRGFAIFFERGDVSPTVIFYECLRINITNFAEWKDILTIGKDKKPSTKSNERNFFESIWIALKSPLVLGGKKYGKKSKRRNNSKSRISKKIR
jgi:hypothetical protein